MKKRIFLVFIFAALALGGCVKKADIPIKGNVITEGIKEDVSLKPGENIPVSRAVAAKMLALAFSTTEEISNMDKEISFSDVDEKSWYYPYINRVCFLGLMRGTDEGFLPDEPLNLKQVQIILEGISNKKIEANKANDDKPVSFNLWTELFHETLGERLDQLGLKVEDTAVFCTAETGKMPPWSVATDKGVLKCSGYATDAYTDKTIKIIRKENEIVGILSVEKEYAQFNNAYIKSNGDGSVEVFFESGERTFKYSDDIDIPIADVKISNGEIVEVSTAESGFRDIVKLIDNEKLSSEKYGDLNLSGEFRVYDVNDGKAVSKGKAALICGSDIGKIYTKGGVACGAVIDSKAEPKNLRVVIGTTDFSGYVHQEVGLRGDKGLAVKWGAEAIEINELNFPEDDSKYFGETNRIYVEPIKGGTTEITTIERNWQGAAPKYDGVIEIEKNKNGYVIVNEIDMETYLTAVVPSEMPTSYGLEAAKVQAICARSYAYNQFFGNKYHQYGANIDDSVMSQVYNNIPPNDISKKAVKLTEGMYLGHNGEIISANFFSTSCGAFANSGDVWSKGNMFPAESKEYLKAHSVNNKDLSNEESMREFLSSDEAGYDSWNEWSRWSVTMSQTDLSFAIETNLGKAYAASPHLVKTLQEDWEFKSRPIEPLGRIRDIKVLKRGEGGNIMGLKIEGEKNTVLLRTEYIIRTVIRPEGSWDSHVATVLKNGREVSNYSLMPSAYFVMNTEKDEEGFIKSITFLGGGNGHGVGMSQNGVKQMVDEGKDYTEILDYYYEGTEILTK